jgi:DNA-directed RNA polymerase subunit L
LKYGVIATKEDMPHEIAHHVFIRVTLKKQNDRIERTIHYISPERFKLLI